MTYDEFVIGYVSKELEKVTSMRELGRKTGIQPSVISKMVSGSYIPRPRTFIKMFPDAIIPEDVEEHIHVHVYKEELNINCKELDELKKQIKKLGYKLELNITKI